MWWDMVWYTEASIESIGLTLHPYLPIRESLFSAVGAPLEVSEFVLWIEEGGDGSSGASMDVSSLLLVFFSMGGFLFVSVSCLCSLLS